MQHTPLCELWPGVSSLLLWGCSVVSHWDTISQLIRPSTHTKHTHTHTQARNSKSLCFLQMGLAFRNVFSSGPPHHIFSVWLCCAYRSIYCRTLLHPPHTCPTLPPSHPNKPRRTWAHRHTLLAHSLSFRSWFRPIPSCAVSVHPADLCKGGPLSPQAPLRVSRQLLVSSLCIYRALLGWDGFSGCLGSAPAGAMVSLFDSLFSSAGGDSQMSGHLFPHVFFNGWYMIRESWGFTLLGHFLTGVQDATVIWGKKMETEWGGSSHPVLAEAGMVCQCQAWTA